MKLSTKLFVMAGLVASGMLVERRRQRRARELEGGIGARTGTLGSPVQDAELVTSGIASVDPEPLSTMGEAIDPDAVESAHQRAPTLPKNVP